MAGFPVTIRLLDPPLRVPAVGRGTTSDADARRIEQLREANPMLGTRGCRLGLQWPEIYEMQVRAIVRAARVVADRTGEPPLVEIMHPLVGFAELPAPGSRRSCRRGGPASSTWRDDDRAAASLHACGRDRRERGLLLVRHQRPHSRRRSASRATTPRASSSRTTSSTGSSSGATRSRCSTVKVSAT